MTIPETPTAPQAPQAPPRDASTPLPARGIAKPPLPGNQPSLPGQRSLRHARTVRGDCTKQPPAPILAAPQTHQHAICQASHTCANLRTDDSESKTQDCLRAAPQAVRENISGGDIGCSYSAVGARKSPGRDGHCSEVSSLFTAPVRPGGILHKQDGTDSEGVSAPLQAAEAALARVRAMRLDLSPRERQSSPREHSPFEHSRERRASAKTPRGNGSPTAFRSTDTLPPPHIACGHQRELAAAHREKQLASAAKRGFRDVGGLPWWAGIVAARARKHWRREVAYLPKYVQTAVTQAVLVFDDDERRGNVAAIGCVLLWMSLRHPKRCGRVTNVGGISTGCLQRLTLRRNGKRYSASSIQHRDHVGADNRGDERAPGEGPGMHGGRAGDWQAGECGFVETLRQAGALQSWIPPAKAVPDWMRGAYAFAVYRAPKVPGEVVADAERSQLAVFLATVGAVPF